MAADKKAAAEKKVEQLEAEIDKLEAANDAKVDQLIEALRKPSSAAGALKDKLKTVVVNLWRPSIAELAELFSSSQHEAPTLRRPPDFEDHQELRYAVNQQRVHPVKIEQALGGKTGAVFASPARSSQDRCNLRKISGVFGRSAHCNGRARRSGPWPSGRTWYLASRFLAAIDAVSPGNRVLQGAALAGLVGDQALPFMEYREALNLPDPEDILKDPRRFVLPDRVDRAYAVCYALAGAVINNNTPPRWEAAMIALSVACRKNADIPAAAARTLCDQRNRPEGVMKLPEECRPFYELVQMAKLVPRERENRAVMQMPIAMPTSARLISKAGMPPSMASSR